MPGDFPVTAWPGPLRLLSLRAAPAESEAEAVAAVASPEPETVANALLHLGGV